MRFAPPRQAARKPVRDVVEGDWALCFGYWWRVRRPRPGPADMKLVDLESPRGKHWAIYAVHLVVAREAA